MIRVRRRYGVVLQTDALLGVRAVAKGCRGFPDGLGETVQGFHGHTR